MVKDFVSVGVSDDNDDVDDGDEYCFKAKLACKRDQETLLFWTLIGLLTISYSGYAMGGRRS